MKHSPKGRIKARDIDPLSPQNPLSADSESHINGRLRCSAHSKQKGTRCGRTAIPGGTVCRYHGGAAPQVKLKAQERLAAFQDAAITRLMQLAQQQEYPSTAFAAVRDVLDRTMGKPVEQVNTEHSGEIALRWQND